MSIKTFIGIKDTSIKSVSNAPVGSIKTILGSGLNLNITDAMMEEDGDFYFASEDEADVYLQLVEE